jgi:polyhydroxybutyrate depolymerase
MLVALLTCASITSAVAACTVDDRPDAAADGGSVTASVESQTTEARTAADPSDPSGDPVPSPGCGSGTAAGTVVEEHRSIDVDGVERWFLLTAPEAVDDEPLPLLLDFHGLSEGAEIHTRMSGLGELALTEGFVLAFPNGTGSPVRWLIGPDDNPDVRFVDVLIDTLAAERCIDLSRVYSTGLSNGAMFSSLLACERADRIAAIAPIAGVLHPEGCRPGRPVPVMAVHGTADPILHFNGGVGSLDGLMSGAIDPSSAGDRPADLDGDGYPANVRRWAEHNGCEPEPTDTRPVPGVVLRSYDCPDGASVRFYVVEGGGHSWPGSEFSQAIASIVGTTNMDLRTSELLWDFVSRYRLPQA